VINATPEAVYAVLRDYEQHHPRILPQQNFSDLRVEEGGQGAGTVFRVRSRVMGTERAFHMRVTEPEPGRVLVERDIPTDLVTTFTVTPLNEGQQARVTIATEWEASRGLVGLIERVATPRMLRQIYEAELALLEAYMVNRGS
jgi:hypothetical protein